MSGGAAVIEAIGAIARLALPVRVIGVVGATENMPSGRSMKPGDIVRTLAGVSVEINNTDAEGRLVLADCLTYATAEGAERLVDLATLTGSCVVALGHSYAGLMSNNDEWCADRDGRRAAQRRARLAAAAASGVREHRQGNLRRPQQRSAGPVGRSDHSCRVPAPFRRRNAVGAPRYRGHRLGSRSRLRREGRFRLRRAPARRAGARAGGTSSARPAAGRFLRRGLRPQPSSLARSWS